MFFKKNFIILIIVTLWFAGSLGVMARADDIGIDATVNAVNASSTLLPKKVAGGGTVAEVVGNVVAVGLSLIGVVFFLLALYAGVMWMSAAGNSENVTKAKDTLQMAVVGLIIVLAAYAITSFVLGNIAPGAGAESGTTATVQLTPDQVACRGNCVQNSCPICSGYSQKDVAEQQQCEQCSRVDNLAQIQACQGSCK